jgi:hypothetical protein
MYSYQEEYICSNKNVHSTGEKEVTQYVENIFFPSDGISNAVHIRLVKASKLSKYKKHQILMKKRVRKKAKTKIFSFNL